MALLFISFGHARADSSETGVSTETSDDESGEESKSNGKSRKCAQPTKTCPDGVTITRANPKKECRYEPPCPEKAPEVCTNDTKVCSDGSLVSRNKNLNCDFDPCPDGAPSQNTVEKKAVSTYDSRQMKTDLSTKAPTSAQTSSLLDPSGNFNGISISMNQSQSLCQAAAVGAMGSILQLDAGDTEKGVASYQGAYQMAQKAGGLNNGCEVTPVTKSFLRQGSAGDLSQQFENVTGVSRDRVLEHMNKLAANVKNGQQGSSMASLKSLIGSFPDTEKQEKLASELNGVEEKPLDPSEIPSTEQFVANFGSRKAPVAAAPKASGTDIQKMLKKLMKSDAVGPGSAGGASLSTPPKSANIAKPNIPVSISTRPTANLGVHEVSGNNKNATAELEEIETLVRSERDRILSNEKTSEDTIFTRISRTLRDRESGLKNPGTNENYKSSSAR